MKKSFLLLIVAAFFTVPSNAQFLNRLTDKAMKAAEKGVTKAVEKSVEKTTEKATEKILGTAEKAVEKEVDKTAEAVGNAATNATQAYTNSIIESANEVNASATELNRVTDSIRVANGQPAQASGAGMAGLMSSYMTLMGAGTPTIEDKGDEVILAWQYIQFNLEWHAKFKGDQCSESKMMYIFQTPELATQYYREQTADMDKDKAKLWSVQDKTVIEDNTQEYSSQDKVAVKAAMQQIVLSRGGKLE
ncbi:MAG: hypothetical protein IJU24_05285 [Bacteroidaceae bacterium]|nr:hypothetical protein [Bacteroidaceae bacterium]